MKLLFKYDAFIRKRKVVEAYVGPVVGWHTCISMHTNITEDLKGTERAFTLKALLFLCSGSEPARAIGSLKTYFFAVLIFSGRWFRDIIHRRLVLVLLHSAPTKSFFKSNLNVTTHIFINIILSKVQSHFAQVA